MSAPTLRGAIDYKYAEREFTIRLPMPTLRVANNVIATQLAQTDLAFFMVGQIQK